MAKQRRVRSEPSPAPDRPAVTADRFARLYRLVQLLAKTGQSREVLARRLGVDVRGFYRDLDLPRKAGITVTLTDEAPAAYTLTDDFDLAMSRLPFPDPASHARRRSHPAGQRGADESAPAVVGPNQSRCCLAELPEPHQGLNYKTHP